MGPWDLDTRVRENVRRRVCDLDGVLGLWDQQAMRDLDRAYGLAQGTLSSTAFAPERLHPAITGTQTDEEWRSAVASDLARACGSADTAQALVADWSAMIGEVDQSTARLLARAREHVPVILISNATTRLETDLNLLGITALVDEIVNSARIGFAKPDPRIYRLAAQRAGAGVARCLFIDDTADNVDAARAAGMIGVHYQRPEHLRMALAPALEVVGGRPHDAPT